MTKLLTLFSHATGLNTKDDPTREVVDEKIGIKNLSSAVNVTIDNTGGINRRQGYNQTVSGEFHSIWSDQGSCFAIKETVTYGSIMQIGVDLLATGVRANLTKNKRMSFLDWNSETYYTNGFQNGVINNGVSSAWPQGSYAGPDTTRQFENAPVGSHLAKHKGRMIVAEDNVIWFSEPYAPGLFDKSRMFWQFGTRIRMVKSVTEGLFVSDENNTYFLSGSSPLDFEQKTIAPYPVHEWSVAHDMLELDDLNLDQKGLGIIWSSPKGICIGLPTGEFVNITKDKLTYPTSFNKGACLTCGYHVINTMYY